MVSEPGRRRTTHTVGPKGVMLVALCIVWAVCLNIALANARTSTSWTMTMDATTVGGGSSTSATFREADSAIGTEVPAGSESSVTYRNQAGAIQAWEELAFSSVGDWKDY